MIEELVSEVRRGSQAHAVLEDVIAVLDARMNGGRDGDRAVRAADQSLPVLVLTVMNSHSGKWLRRTRRWRPSSVLRFSMLGEKIRGRR
jgi:hypothetical protein